MAYEFIKTENRDGVLVLTMHDRADSQRLGPGDGGGSPRRTGPLRGRPELPRAAGHRHRPLLLLRRQRAQLQPQHPGSGKRRRLSRNPCLGARWRPVWLAATTESNTLAARRWCLCASTSCKSPPSPPSTATPWAWAWAWPWPATSALPAKGPSSPKRSRAWA